MVKEYRNQSKRRGHDLVSWWSLNFKRGAPSTVRRKTLRFTLTISSEKRAGNYPGCQRVFFRSEAAIVSGEAAIVILAREEKKSLWTRQLQVSLPCVFETNYTLPNRFLRDLFVFDKSARCATMRETVQMIARWRKAKFLRLKGVIKVRRLQVVLPGKS